MEKRIKIQAQKATRTGSVRRFDDLGRIVVPREIRKRMGYEEGSPFEIIPIAEGIFTASYWDYDYCYPHLYDRTDRIVFDAMRDEMQEKFEKYRGEVEALVSEHMKDVQGLSGPWSIDIMLDEGFTTPYAEKPNEFWLIDMAVAERSAYWENRPSKLALETVPEKED